jgi:hypothetical protein
MEIILTGRIQTVKLACFGDSRRTVCIRPDGSYSAAVGRRCGWSWRFRYCRDNDGACQRASRPTTSGIPAQADLTTGSAEHCYTDTPAVAVRPSPARPR